MSEWCIQTGILQNDFLSLFIWCIKCKITDMESYFVIKMWHKITPPPRHTHTGRKSYRNIGHVFQSSHGVGGLLEASSGSVVFLCDLIVQVGNDTETWGMCLRGKAGVVSSFWIFLFISLSITNTMFAQTCTWYQETTGHSWIITIRGAELSTDQHLRFSWIRVVVEDAE